MQKQRVDILKGMGFQSNMSFETYLRMLISEAWTPDSDMSTFWIMREKYNHAAM